MSPTMWTNHRLSSTRHLLTFVVEDRGSASVCSIQSSHPDFKKIRKTETSERYNIIERWIMGTRPQRFSISWIFFVVKNNFLSLRLLKSERKWVQTSRAWLHFFRTANSKVPLSQSEADGHLDKCKKHRIVTILWGFVIIQELHGYEYRQKNLIVLMLCGHISCRK